MVVVGWFVAAWIQEFVGEWEGTYPDMEVEYLTIRAWEFNAFGVNRLIGVSSELLDDVARSKMDRMVYIFKHDPTGLLAKEHACTVNFKFELQEKYSFLIDFRDWEVQGSNASLWDDEDDPQNAQSESGAYRRLTFGLERSRATWWDKCELCLLKLSCYACGFQRKKGDDTVLPIQHG